MVNINIYIYYIYVERGPVHISTLAYHTMYINKKNSEAIVLQLKKSFKISSRVQKFRLYMGCNGYRAL